MYEKSLACQWKYEYYTVKNNRSMPMMHNILTKCTEAEFLDNIQTKVLRVFLLATKSHLYSFSLRFLFFQTHSTSYSFFRNPKSEISQDYAQTPQRNFMFMNYTSGI